MAASAGGKSLRARCGVPLRPPVPAGRRRPWPAAGASSVVSRPCPVRAAVGRLRSRRPRRRPRPRRSARANKVGGLLQRPLAAAPLRRRAPPLRPRPPVLAPGRGYFVFAAAGLGIAPPAGGAKGLPGRTRCAVWVRCTWLRHESSAIRNYSQPRLTAVRRE